VGNCEGLRSGESTPVAAAPKPSGIVDFNKLWLCPFERLDGKRDARRSF